MLALFTTLLDIIRLRKGPDALPYSQLLFAAVFALWLLAGAIMVALTARLTAEEYVLGTLTGLAGLACYAGLVAAAGRRARLLQTLTAIMGCGAVLTLVFVAGDLLLPPLLGQDGSNLIITLILLWSIPVEGHIIARALERQWFVGVIAAVAVFVFQLFLHAAIDPAAATAS